MRMCEELLARNLISEQEHRRFEEELSRFKNPSRRLSTGQILDRLFPDGDYHKKCDEIEEERSELWRRAGGALEAAYLGEAILFIGAGFNFEARSKDRPFSGEVIRESLLEGLRPDVPEPEFAYLQSQSLDTIAEVFQGHHPDLPDRVARICASEIPTEPSPQHRLLSELTCFRFIVTTNWDRLIESAFARWNQRRHLRVIRGSADVAHLDFSRVNLLKIHGDYDSDGECFAVPPRISSSKIQALEHEEPATFKLLESLFSANSVIVLGFRPDDYNFNRLLDSARRALGDNQKPIYFIDPASFLQPHRAPHKATHIEMSAESFLYALKTFSEYEGGKVGVSFSTDKERGAVSVWARELCKISDNLLERFPKLSRVEVVDARHRRGETSRDSVGRRAAAVLRQVVSPGDSVAFSCGSTLRALVDMANSSWDSFQDTKLYSTSIPAFDDCNAVAPIGLITLLAQRLDGLNVEGRSYQLPSRFVDYLVGKPFRPFIGVTHDLDNEPLRKAVGRYLAEAAEAQVTFLGVGAIATQTAGFRSYAMGCLRACRTNRELDEDLLQRYLDVLSGQSKGQLGYVGDVMYWPFKEMTRESHALEEKFMNHERLLGCLEDQSKVNSKLFVEFLVRIFCHVRSIPISSLVKASEDKDRTVALVATGKEKSAAVRSLCECGLGDTLIVDRELAVALLDD